MYASLSVHRSKKRAGRAAAGSAISPATSAAAKKWSAMSSGRERRWQSSTSTPSSASRATASAASPSVCDRLKTSPPTSGVSAGRPCAETTKRSASGGAPT